LNNLLPVLHLIIHILFTHLKEPLH